MNCEDTHQCGSWYQETRRRQQVEAAERRRQQEDARGVKDPQRVLRQQHKAVDIEKKAEQLNREGGAALRVSTMHCCYVACDHTLANGI